MIKDRINRIAARLFDIQADELRDSMSPMDIDSWDSFTSMQLIAELEKEFNVKFEMEEVFDIQCLGDIGEILSKKTPDAN